MENAGYLFAAYAVVWVVLFGYLFFLMGRQRRLQQEIQSLKAALQEKQSNK